MKKILLMLFALLTLCGCVFAEDVGREVMIYYKVPNTILEAQNKKEDIIAGREEFEKKIASTYGKRFTVISVKPYPESLPKPLDLKSLRKPNAVPFIIEISLEGTGVSVDQYSNAFGATTAAAAPSVNVHLIERVGDYDDNQFYGYDYGVQSYSKGTDSIGRYVFAVDTDPRRNAKDSVNAAMRDACKLNTSINKYASPKIYEREHARYQGQFKEMAIEKKALESKDEAEIEEFLKWCKTIPGGDQIALGLQGMPTLPMKMEYIKAAKAMFVPQPAN